ncbi:HPr family phosphocarrier protein [Alcanivorax sp. 1008]|uniref:HPr family phosphocarrier protein n=1 Tax=Alcanivorax sp. 1008 TaxID=2816853 RepID=UPI001E18DCA0|nr:HPr family phosphocarrier protein [Alcanivorax sp. 1008]MCC1495215.1 HPr family phosphocarrier protein [Alcanivorax sp. 1008]
MERAELTVINRLGLHARAAAKVVAVASRHDASVRVRKDGREVDARNIMALLMLAAAKGSSVEVEADGPEAKQALAEISALFARRFDEEE